MLLTSIGPAYQVDGTDRYVPVAACEKVCSFSPKELKYLFFVLWCYRKGLIRS